MSDILNLALGLTALAKSTKMDREDLHFLIDCAFQHWEMEEDFRRLFRSEETNSAPAPGITSPGHQEGAVIASLEAIASLKGGGLNGKD